MRRLPVKGRLRELRPHQPPAGGSFSLRAKSRLRRLRSDTRLRAQPLGGKPLELTGAFSPWGRRCPRPRPRTDEGRACGCCPLKGRLRKLRPHQPPAGGSFPRGGKPLERAQPLGRKPLELTGAFSPWGRRCPRPRPRTDEGRACGGCPLKGRPRKLRPHQPPAGGSFPLGGKPLRRQP